MGKIKFFSIKWKISAVFVVVSLCVIALFVWTAKRVFEDDKIAYIFDSQQSQINSISKNLKSTIEEAIFQTNILSSEFNFQHNNLSESGKRNFEHHKYLLSFELYSPENNKTIGLVLKDQFELPIINRIHFVNTINMSILNSGLLLMIIPVHNQGRWMQAYTVLDLSESLPQSNSLSLFAIQQNGKILTTTNSSDLNLKTGLEEILKSEPQVKFGNTAIKNTNFGNYLIARSPVGSGELEVLSLTSSSQALRALKTLMQKMIVYIFFAICLIIAVSILISIHLTKNLAILRQAAEQISIGQFSTKTLVKSKDELGILSSAFEKMSSEIQRLLQETKDKERMAAELKTARLVQESLLPTHSSAQFANFNIHGTCLSSSECGGDWWYYFSDNNFLYVVIADATGHGTSAALITAAARSVFSKIERTTMNLEEMMIDWNHAVTSCSKAQVYMTGTLLKINLMNGQVEALNASHELPISVNFGTNVDTKVQSIDLALNPTLGETLQTKWKLSKFTIEPKSQVILYTDGLLAITNSEGKTIREKYIHQSISKHATFSCSSTDMASHIEQTLHKYKKETQIPDDITFVVIQRDDV